MVSQYPNRSPSTYTGITEFGPPLRILTSAVAADSLLTYMEKVGQLLYSEVQGAGPSLAVLSPR
jgi:hypothetical protein